MRKFRGLVVAALVLLILSIQAPSVDAAGVDKARTFSGFAFEKTALTSSMKRAITAWITANPGYNMISCIGYTGYNVKNRTPEFLQKLAEDRAKNVCDYVHAKYSAFTIYSTTGIPGDGKTADARKVTIRLLSVSNTGPGDGAAVIGVCDTDVNIVMKSRIIRSVFYFGTMIIKNIASTCSGKVVDVYLLDSDGNQVASSSENAITGTSVTLGYAKFDLTQVRSDSIAKVAIEIRAPQ